MAGEPVNRARRGRGAALSPDNRYSEIRREGVDDGWTDPEGPAESPRTSLEVDKSRTVITYNDSPDVGFDRSINPYRGCEHGCVYCFARPTHAYLDLSPGLDFESRLFYKPQAPALLREELAARRYDCAPVVVGINTDAYQPVERRVGLTRAILEVLGETAHPFSIVTKSSLIERDIDMIAAAAAQRRAGVVVSITTLDRELARRMEPRAAAPQRRLEIIRRLHEAGVPVGVLVAPVIPALTDHELEAILAAAREAGAAHAGYVLLRLPHELGEMFEAWLQAQEPLRAGHVMARLRETRGGRAYRAEFGTRMTGTGEYADLIGQRFRLAHRRLGYAAPPELDCSGFRKPSSGGQISLF